MEFLTRRSCLDTRWEKTSHHFFITTNTCHAHSRPFQAKHAQKMSEKELLYGKKIPKNVRNVTLLNGKSVSRVKSVFQGVKRFSMRDPFAPRMDHSYPSLRGQTMIHKWSKWITNGETSLLGRLISRKNHFYKLSMELCSTIALLTNEGGFYQLP